VLLSGFVTQFRGGKQADVRNKENTTRRIEQTWEKVNAILLQALTGPEVSRRLRLPDFNTIGT
jgi:hypothetical protein